MEVWKMTIIRDLKKSLMRMENDKIKLSKHTMQRMNERGYVKGDLVSCIMTGNLLEVQWEKRKPKYIITGRDLDNNPIVIAVGFHKTLFTIITVMPPTDHSRFTDCI